MHEAVGELTVVSEQQQALGLGVQAANVEQALPLLEALVDEVAHRRATHVVAHRGLDAARLIEDVVVHLIVDLDAHSVDADDVLVRVDAHAHPIHNLAVDLDSARGDELLAHAAAGHAGGCQDLLQADLVLRSWGGLLL